jgi:signal transduction histidine kinase
MNEAFRAGIATALVDMRRQSTPSRLAAAGAVIALLGMATSEARHTVLEVVAALGLLIAGSGFLLRYRIAGTRTARHLGQGLMLLGSYRPASEACEALLDGRFPEVPRVTALLLVLAAAASCLGAVPSPRPRRRTLTVSALTAAAVSAGLADILTLATAASPLVVAAHGASVLLTGALWTAVAVCAWRADAVGARDRASLRALAGVALAIGALGVLHAAPVAFPAVTLAVQTVGDIGLLIVAAISVVVSLRRLDDALGGQERYVSGLLEQLAGHERHLQAVRACLHDARAAVAGVRAGSSALRHLPAADRARADLEDAVAAELGRIERMLRLPERPASAAPGDLDGLLRPLVVSHRERGLRVAWPPLERGPVTVDGDALAVIVGNLLGNALVHAPGALCRVDVEVGNELTVTISDNGPGIPLRRRAAAFEAGARSADSPGEGLGLAISRDLARRHGGDLVADAPARGSRFVLTLPVGPAPVTVPAPRDGRVIALPAAA